MQFPECQVFRPEIASATQDRHASGPSFHVSTKLEGASGDLNVSVPAGYTFLQALTSASNVTNDIAEPRSWFKCIHDYMHPEYTS